MSTADAARAGSEVLRIKPLVAVSKDGLWAASATRAGVDRIDLRTGARTRVAEGSVEALVFVGSDLWLLDGRSLRCAANNRAYEVGPAKVRLFVDGDAVAYSMGSRLVRIARDGDQLEVPLGERRAVGFAAHGLIACTRPGRLAIVDLGGSVRAEMVVGDFDVLATEPIFAGRFSSCWMSSPQGDELWVIEPRGALARRIELPTSRAWAVASDRGVAITLDGENTLRLTCLRAGRVCDTVISPVENTSAIATDTAGRALLVTATSRSEAARLVQLDYQRIFARPSTPDGHDVQPQPNQPPQAQALEPEPEPIHEPEPTPLLPAMVRGLAPTGGRSTLSTGQRAALLEVEVRWWRARAAQVIADRWHRGVLGTRHNDRVPFECEVLALADAAPEREVPAESVAAIEAELASATELRAALHASFDGELTPMAELAARFQLSSTETEMVAACAVAALDADVRRLYAIASGADGWATEAFLARLVAPSPLDHLVAIGLLHRDALTTPTASLVPNPALLDVLRYPPSPTPSPPDVDALLISREANNSLELALSSQPPRFVLRGAPGRGRVALARYLADLAGNALELLDGGDELGSALVATRIHGRVPCVRLPGDCTSLTDLRADRGPLIVCVPPGSPSPLEPGAPIVDLAALSDWERRSLWRRLLPDGPITETNALAARFRVPPAIAIDVVERVGRDVDMIERALRGSLGEALRSVAEPIAELPTWSEVILDADLASSLRELIGRRRNFDRVCFDWGMSSAMRSARGMVALFSGPPGTGKTLAAGLVARELDRPLFRIDLSRVISKWIGETEKNLAVLFDAAEQADAVVLFDEADSLFAKRTAVQSANDRNANLEVNYILQRLDTFSGVAILTTNQRSSIDAAFKRRLTAQLHFPLPDAETRERLWRAHVPVRAPVAKDLELAELAERYPFTGGQIRNIAIRAAFLAAGADVPLTQAHFQRAIELEYAERGKLSASGRLE